MTAQHRFLSVYPSRQAFHLPGRVIVQRAWLITSLLSRTTCAFQTSRRLFDLYSILGVSKTASEDEIRQAYKQKAKKLHPDINKAANAHEQFAKLGEAHEVLSDANKRRNYDQTGIANPQEAEQQAQQQNMFRNFGGRGGGGGVPGYEPPRKPSPLKHKPVKGKDVTAKVRLDLQDIVNDKLRQVHYGIEEECEPCGGTGSKDKAPLVNCGTCDGDGFLPVRQGPFIVQWQRCDECDGHGKRIRVFCGTCRGKGMAQREVNVEINIPKGVENGQKFRIAKKGSCGPHGGPRGDLLLEAVVAEHDYFIKRGLDIHLVMPIPLILAIAGGPYKAITVHGEAEIQIPPGTQYGDTLVLKGQGLQKGESKGDQHVHLAVLIPEEVDAAAIPELQKLLPVSYPNPDSLRELKAKFEPTLKK